MSWKEEFKKEYHFFTNDIFETNISPEVIKFIETQVIEKLIDDCIHQARQNLWLSGMGADVFRQQLRAKWLGKETI